MTQPSYTTDLSTFNLCENSGTFGEFTGMADGGSPDGTDTDDIIQGTYLTSATCSLKVGELQSIYADYGSGITIPTDGAVLIWFKFDAGGILLPYASGGVRIVIGTSATVWYAWQAGGVDRAPNPYGGWYNYAINPAIGSPDYSAGTVTTYNLAGMAIGLSAAGPSKGQPFKVDAMRYGRCSSIFEYGDATNGYCTLDDFAKANDANDISFTADTTSASPNLTNIAAGEIVKLYPGAPVSGTGIPASTFIKYISGASTAVMTQNATATNTGVAVTSQPYNRWGLIQAVAGGYRWKGKMQFGSASNAVDFRDSNRLVLIQATPNVTANFNTIEIINASSNVEMTGFQFICLDPDDTTSKGRWITTNDATVTLDACVFIDMATFTFDSNTAATGCTWRRCAQIDPGGGDISFGLIDESTVTGGGSAGGGAVLWNDSADPNTYLNDCTFVKGAGSHHAIEFGTSAPLTINLTNITVSGFSVSDQQTTSALYFPDTGSDVTWTVNHTGTTGTLSYYKARSGDTVNISSSVPVTITVKDVDGNLLDGVQTGVWKTSDRTQIMNEDTVSGVASENYTGSTPVEVEVRCRKASPGSTKYKNYSSIQTIGTGGLTLSVTLVVDPNNAS